MKIETLRIQNLRGFADETITFNSYNCLVGPNGAGKSTVLCALNILFREPSGSTTDLFKLSAEDFFEKNTSEPVTITATFTDLSDAAKEDFGDYVRDDKLVISAIAKFDPSKNCAEVKQFGQRMAFEPFVSYFAKEGDGAKVPELQGIFNELRSRYPDIAVAKTRDAMTSALRDFEKDRSDKKLVKSEDQFYGVSKGRDRLQKYVQWIYVPAVKDAATEQMEGKNTALGKLLARTVRAKVNFEASVAEIKKRTAELYDNLLSENEHALTELSTSLAKRLAEWAHPGASLKLTWRSDADKSVRIEEPIAQMLAGEGNFEGELSRFGHGLQRSYLLALLQELASFDESEAPTLILGCEEPELYQHPPQARHLAAVLTKLAETNSQIIITTHHPAFVSGTG